MIGQIRCFIPAVRRGTIQTDAGRCVVFHALEGHPNLHGGDIVEFDPPPDQSMPVGRLVLRHRWADQLNTDSRPLVNQFYATIQIQY